MFEKVRLLAVERDKSQKNDLGQQMERHIKEVMTEVGMTIKDYMHPLIKATHYIKARFALTKPPYDRAIELVRSVDNRLAGVIEEMFDQQTTLFWDLIHIVFDLEPKTNKLYSNYRDRNVKAFQEATSALNSADKLYKENQDIIHNWDEDKQAWGAERARLMKDVQSLEAENKKYLSVILKHSKNKADQAIDSDIQRQATSQPLRESGLHHQITEVEMRSIKNNHLVSDTNIRVLTLKQLTDTIDEIYESKLKCDQKYIESKLPRETMEQHMYTYLNTKYGLKNLIIEWATALVNGIKKFGTLDNQVAVFGKILRNECDEEFRFVQAQVKTTITELLKMLIKSKYPYKNKQEVQDLLDAKMEGYLSEEEVHEIVKYMYSKEDSGVILNTVRTLLSRGAHLGNDRRLTREERQQVLKEQEKKRIKFSVFQKIILDFQMKSHENFLNSFIEKFRTIDRDQNGIIDEQELRHLLKIVDPRNEMSIKVEDMLDLLDPDSNDIITFSSLVTLLSSHLTSYQGKQLSVLHRLSLE